MARLLLIAVAAFLTFEPAQTRALPEITGDLTRGPFAVGFRKEVLTLPPASLSRPTTVDVFRWYPARAADAPEHMRLADYYAAQGDGAVDGGSLQAALRVDMTDPPGVTDAMLADALEARLWAIRDAEPVERPFPLLLWTYRDSIPTMQPLLAEYLASHGYNVAFAWPRDRVPAFPWNQDLTEQERRDALAAQVDLLSVTLDSVVDIETVDGGRVGLLSWSYGGESAHGLQRLRPDVDLVVGVDANLVSGWVYRDAADLANLGPSELVAPHVLLRHGSARVGGNETPVPEPLGRVAGGSWYGRFPALHHGNFNFPGGMLPGVLGLDTVSGWAVGGEVAQRGYEAMCRLVLQFADAFLGEAGAHPDTIAEQSDDLVELSRFAPIVPQDRP
ncbi:MAG: hypothetical protein GKS06_18920 [Acidobacteria bacterium]|nr:hypothetical protein [Acidobacteriota bacterium]